MSHAFGKSSSWLNRPNMPFAKRALLSYIQLIRFDINCLHSVGLSPGEKLNFEWYKQIVLRGSPASVAPGQRQHPWNVHSSPLVDTSVSLVSLAGLLSSAPLDSWQCHVCEIITEPINIPDLMKSCCFSACYRYKWAIDLWLIINFVLASSRITFVTVTSWSCATFSVHIWGNSTLLRPK